MLAERAALKRNPFPGNLAASGGVSWKALSVRNMVIASGLANLTARSLKTSELEVDERLLHHRHCREAEGEQCAEPAPRERPGPSGREREPQASAP
jgi:hypothetical protein